MTSLIVVPLLAPTVWGLLSRRIGTKSVWLTAGICFLAGALVNFGFSKGGFLENVSALEMITVWIQSNHRLMQQIVGVLLPILILAYLEWRSSETDRGWTHVEDSIKTISISETPSKLPARVVSWSLLSLGILMAVLGLAHGESSGVLFVFSALLFVIGAAVGMYIRKKA